MTMPLDRVIRQARLPEHPRTLLDVGIQSSQIVQLGTVKTQADWVDHADGRWLLPGFVDLHGHSDASLLADPRGLSKLSQGVTTEVVGNCSMGLAPLPEPVADVLADSFGYLGARRHQRYPSLADYREALAEKDLRYDVAVLVGHGCLRLSALEDPNQPADENGRRHLRDELTRALEQGAVGCSLGLMYEPSRYADQTELITLGQVLSDHDAILSVHLRNEGWQAVQALEEVLEVSRRTGVRLQVSHLKAAGPTNDALVQEMITSIQQARDEGLPVSADLYPYCRGSTTLGSLIPEPQAETELLDERMRTAEPPWPGCFGPGALPPERVTLAEVREAEFRHLQGHTLEQLSESLNAPPWAAARELLNSVDRDPVVLLDLLREEDVDAVFQQSWGFVASDGKAIAPEQTEAMVHPRYYGTYPRFLNRWVFEQNRRTMPRAVHQTATGPADLLNLSDRGRIAVGARADLVLLDESTLKSPATYDQPHRLSRGISRVYLRGVPVWKDGEPTDHAPGQVI